MADQTNATGTQIQKKAGQAIPHTTPPIVDELKYKGSPKSKYESGSAQTSSSIPETQAIDDMYDNYAE